MPALVPTEIYATVIWVGVVRHRNKPDLDGEKLDVLSLGFAGIEGSVHGGLNRASCSRVISQHPRGTEIKNARQVSVICTKELAEIAEAIGVEEIDPRDMGASIVLSGIPDFTHVPPSSRLQAENGATIVVDMENLPCQFPALSIDKRDVGHGKAFKSAAKNRRGIAGWVERGGDIKVGDTLRLHIPDQRVWALLDDVRSHK